MRQEEKRYTITEIVKTTGLTKSVIQGRRSRLGIDANRDGYTSEEVKKIVKYKPIRKKWKQGNVDELKNILKNDGVLPY